MLPLKPLRLTLLVLEATAVVVTAAEAAEAATAITVEAQAAVQAEAPAHGRFPSCAEVEFAKLSKKTMLYYLTMNCMDDDFART